MLVASVVTSRAVEPPQQDGAQQSAADAPGMASISAFAISAKFLPDGLCLIISYNSPSIEI